MRHQHIVFLLLTVIGFLLNPSGAASCDGPSRADMSTGGESDRQRYQNSIALHTKLLCSAVFVSGRQPLEVIRNDLQWSEYYFHDWSTTQWSIDQESQRVSLWTEGGPPYTAVFNPSLGCSLLPLGADQLAFEPISVASQLPPAHTLAWPNGDLNAHGETGDQDGLIAMLDFAFDHGDEHPVQNTRGIVVLHQGKIVAERYAEGYTQDSPMIGWSMGKSISAALMGILVHQTGFDIDAPAPIPEWRGPDDPRGAITPKHLLHMAGGLAFRNPGADEKLYYTDLHDHESVYFRGQNTEHFVLNQSLAYEPGSVFEYRNTNTLALMSILKNADIPGKDHHLSWPRTELFDRIGARSFVLEPDAFGNFVITGNDYATARDWARLGLLFLQDGQWGDERLWPDGWLRTISQPSPAQEYYGGQVWLNTKRGYYPNAPADAVMFVGWLNQVVVIIPSRDIVIVRLGFSDRGGFYHYFDELIRQTLAALD
ncbi:MAG: serine hydrolase [Pseudomonadota bacterium]